MKKKKALKISLISFGSLLVIFALYIMITKGFFTDPKNFVLLSKNKVVSVFHKVSGTTSSISEEIVYTKDNHTVVLDHPKGYSISLPGKMTVDNSVSPEYITASGENIKVTITREWAPYEDVFYYIDNYLNNYYLKPIYQKSNNITLHENKKYEVDGAKAQFISLTRNTENECLDNYSYFFILSKTGKQAFFRVFIKTDDYEKNKDKIYEIINSFEEIPLKGENQFKTKYKPEIPNNWNKETSDLWKEIKKPNTFKWGIFVDGSYQYDKNYQWLKELEEKVDYKFDFALHYVNLGKGFPIDELQKFYDDGKITEMTLQISNHANGELDGKNINFDIYDGKMNDEIRDFARGAKKFKHPFLFRLNNEMNSNWVNYSGVAALSDPEIFRENWKRIYKIFEEEGVDNAIWIFNPNAEDCPPAHWNSYLSYYPGNEYVQLIGLTGYNTGEYYKTDYNEKWRTFDEIYKDTYDRYMEHFDKFPFIITEFASSSVGGDKAKWIDDMFKSIKKYDNVKMALWWSSADYDFREGKGNALARPYFLDETPQTTKAFKDGIKKYKK